jgi:hypothetical protein
MVNHAVKSYIFGFSIDMEDYTYTVKQNVLRFTQFPSVFDPITIEGYPRMTDSVLVKKEILTHSVYP